MTKVKLKTVKEILTHSSDLMSPWVLYKFIPAQQNMWCVIVPAGHFSVIRLFWQFINCSISIKLYTYNRVFFNSQIYLSLEYAEYIFCSLLFKGRHEIKEIMYNCKFPIRVFWKLKIIWDIILWFWQQHDTIWVVFQRITILIIITIIL